MASSQYFSLPIYHCNNYVALYRCTYTVANLKNDFHYYTLVEDFVNTTYERRHTAKLPLHGTVATAPAPSATRAGAASRGTTRHRRGALPCTVYTTAQFNHYSTWFFNSKYYYSVTQHIKQVHISYVYQSVQSKIGQINQEAYSAYC